MLTNLLLLVIGALVGWATPQPEWAASIIAMAKEKIGQFYKSDPPAE